jgi:hypothetical protein
VAVRQLDLAGDEWRLCRGDGEMRTIVAGTHRDSVLQVGWGRGGQDGKFTGCASSGPTAMAKEDCLTKAGAPGCHRAGPVGGRA